MAPVDPDPVKIKTSSLDALKAVLRIFLDSSRIRVIRRDETLVEVCVLP